MYRKSIITLLGLVLMTSAYAQEWSISTAGNYYAFTPSILAYSSVYFGLDARNTRGGNSKAVRIDVSDNGFRAYEYTLASDSIVAVLCALPARNADEVFVLTNRSDSANFHIRIPELHAFVNDTLEYKLRIRNQNFKYALHMAYVKDDYLLILGADTTPYIYDNRIRWLYRYNIESRNIEDSMLIHMGSIILSMHTVGNKVVILDQDSITVVNADLMELHSKAPIPRRVYPKSWLVIDTLAYFFGMLDVNQWPNPVINVDISFIITDFMGNRKECIDSTTIPIHHPCTSFGREDLDEWMYSNSAHYNEKDDRIYIAVADNKDIVNVHSSLPRKIMLISTDREKEDYWFKYYFSEDSYTPTGVFSNDDYIYVICQFNKVGPPMGNLEVHVYKFDKEGNYISSSNQASDLQEGIDVYPNPTSGEINFSGLSNEVYSLQIIDNQGKIAYAEQMISLEKPSYQLDLSSLSAGLYYYRLTSETKAYSGKIMLK